MCDECVVGCVNILVVFLFVCNKGVVLCVDVCCVLMLLLLSIVMCVFVLILLSDVVLI